MFMTIAQSKAPQLPTSQDFPRLPVVGVPVKSSALSGNDSLLSIVQMPKGIPVATVAIGNAANAGLLAVRILGAANPGRKKTSKTLEEDESDGENWDFIWKFIGFNWV